MGEDSEHPEGLDTEALSPEAVNDSLEMIEDEIINAPIIPENVVPLATRYTDYRRKQIDHIVRDNPKAVVLKDFSEELGRFLEKAGRGEYGNLARFLRSDGEVYKRMSGGKAEDPKIQRFKDLGKKLGDVAQVLSPQPGNGPQGTPA